MAEDSIILYPQDYSLESCKIITSLAVPYDFRHMVMDITYFEDLYSNYISGNMTINDAVGMLSSLNFTGNEYLILSFSKPGYENYKIEKTFRIFKVSDRRMVNDQNENYVLHFCSEENILSEQYKVSKSYKDKKISEIVTDIVLNQLKVDPKKFSIGNLEETKNIRDIIIPNFKPFEAINWLCTQAISSTPQTEGSPYLFYENYYGYNFKSLQSLYDGAVYGEYKYEPKNVNSEDDSRVVDLEEAKHNVLSYEPVSVFDTLNMINSGGFANKLIAIDPLRQRYDTTYFDYKTYFPKSKKLNDFDIMANNKNRFSQSANNTYDAVTKVVTTNTGEVMYNSYIKKFQPGIKDINIETTVPYRTAQIAHINYHRYKITIPGDPKMTVGNIIKLNIPELYRTTDGKDADKYYSGKYLVTALRHQIDVENKFVTMLEVSKESVENKFIDPDNSLAAWKDLRSK